MSTRVPSLLDDPGCRVQIARYARAGCAGARSAQARLRATLEREGPALEAALEQVRSESLVYIDPQGATSEQGRLGASAIARAGACDAAERMARLLAERMREAGAAPAQIERASKHWGKTALEDVNRWMALSGARNDWTQVLKRIRGLRDLAPRTLALGRWALLAELGSALVAKLERVDPWVASDACRVLGRDALLGCERAWPGAIIAAHARGLGRGATVRIADGQAALADWRWPGVRPPLTIVAAGAGVLPPIAGDGAWAHALDAEPDSNERWVDGERHIADGWEARRTTPAHEWARARREGEERARARLDETVGWLARRWIEGAGGAGTDAERVLGRWREEWATNEWLAGDGRRFAPALVAHGTMLGWSAMIEGPDALLARCQLSGESPATVMRTDSPERPRLLRMSVHREHYWEWRSRAGRNAEDTAERIVARTGRGAPIDEIALLEAKAGAWTSAPQGSETGRANRGAI